MSDSMVSVKHLKPYERAASHWYATHVLSASHAAARSASLLLIGAPYGFAHSREFVHA
jgi:hypothetical protein